MSIKPIGFAGVSVVPGTLKIKNAERLTQLEWCEAQFKLNDDETGNHLSEWTEIFGVKFQQLFRHVEALRRENGDFKKLPRVQPSYFTLQGTAQPVQLNQLYVGQDRKDETYALSAEKPKERHVIGKIVEDSDLPEAAKAILRAALCLDEPKAWLME